MSLSAIRAKPLYCIQRDSLNHLAFLYVIFWTFLEGKLGQPVQNLLQVTLHQGASWRSP
jgi:hypothetical protein